MQLWIVLPADQDANAVVGYLLALGYQGLDPAVFLHGCTTVFTAGGSFYIGVTEVPNDAFVKV